MQVLQGYTQVTLADAQSITVLRAIQKGNAPSLVAALACDTAAMYQAAAQAFNHFSINNQGSKAAKYAEWKLLVFQGYMYAFTGLFTSYSCIPLVCLLCLPRTSLSGMQTQQIAMVHSVLHCDRPVACCTVSLACVYLHIEVLETDYFGTQKLPCVYLAHHELKSMNPVAPAQDVCTRSAMQCSLMILLLETLLPVVWQQNRGLQMLAGCRSESSEKP